MAELLAAAVMADSASAAFAARRPTPATAADAATARAATPASIRLVVLLAPDGVWYVESIVFPLWSGHCSGNGGRAGHAPLKVRKPALTGNKGIPHGGTT